MSQIFCRRQVTPGILSWSVANVDEDYATFVDFGLIQELKKGNTQAHATGVNPFEGQNTQFLQFGESERSLKTGAGHGAKSHPTHVFVHAGEHASRNRHLHGQQELFFFSVYYEASVASLRPPRRIRLA